MSYVVFMCCTIKILIRTDLGRENSASYYRQKRQLLLTFLTLVTRWSRSVSNFYALIGQNFTGEFMRKNLCSILKLVYFDSYILLTDADGGLCQLVIFLTVFLHWMYKMKPLQSRVLCYSWLVCLLGCWLRNASLVKVENISDGIVFVFHFPLWLLKFSSDPGLLEW